MRISFFLWQAPLAIISIEWLYVQHLKTETLKRGKKNERDMNCTELSNSVFSKVVFGNMQSDLLRRLGKTKVIHI